MARSAGAETVTRCVDGVPSQDSVTRQWIWGASLTAQRAAVVPVPGPGLAHSLAIQVTSTSGMKYTFKNQNR